MPSAMRFASSADLPGVAPELDVALDGTVRQRLRVRGTVQGVGFRPYVYKLATELGLTGYVLNDPGGVVIEVEGAEEVATGLAARLTASPPPLSLVTGVDLESVPTQGSSVFEIRRANHRRDQGPHLRRRRYLRGVRGRDLRPRPAPLPLRVHQLHELRPPFHDRDLDPVRPGQHHDERLRHVRRVPGRVRGPDRQALPCPAHRLPSLRSHFEAGRCRGSGHHGRPPSRARAALLKEGRIVAVKGLGGYHLASTLSATEP